MWTGANTTPSTSRCSSTTASDAPTSRRPLQQFARRTESCARRLINGPSPALESARARDRSGAIPAGCCPRRSPSGLAGSSRRRRSYYILWTGWLVPMGWCFSDVFIFHSYYTAALSPPIAAILGAGIAGLWESRTEVRAVARVVRAAAALIVAGTVGYGDLVDPIVGGRIRRLGCGRWRSRWGRWLLRYSGWSRWSLGPVERILAVAIIAGTAAILVIPASASALLVAEQRGFADTPFESAKTAATDNALLAASSKRTRSFLPQLEKLQMGSPYVMAVYTSAVASGFISSTGKEILPIGGFTGTIPEPTDQPAGRHDSSREVPPCAR